MIDSTSTYNSDHLNSLKDIFGAPDLTIQGNKLSFRGREYPIVEDVIILTEPAQYTSHIKQTLEISSHQKSLTSAFAEDIQFTFGEEWKTYSQVLPEHEREFHLYFNQIDINGLRNSRLCDLGCGIGRWSYFLANRCRELVLVDFSDAIFVARRNLRQYSNILYVMADLRMLPFRSDFCDLLFSLGVLHHLPTPCLDEVRALKRYVPRLLVYLYYALDNRPFYFRVILRIVTSVRLVLSKIRNPLIRKIISKCGTYLIYWPLISLGRMLKPIGWASYIPLYDGYHAMSLQRIEQDVYDRFFTRIEQRVTRKQISQLGDTFTKVEISVDQPYWHFTCER